MPKPTRDDLVLMTQQAAWVREEQAVPREFIVQALERIENGEEEVETYPSGEPSILAVFEVAVRLHAATMLKS